MDKIELISCDGSESDFLSLRNIHAASMKKSIISSLGEWNDDIQKDRLRKKFLEHTEALKFLVVDGVKVGTIKCYIKNFEDGKYGYVEQFYIVPKFQHKGLGYKMIKEFLIKEFFNQKIRFYALNSKESLAYIRKKNCEIYKIDNKVTYFQWLVS